MKKEKIREKLKQYRDLAAQKGAILNVNEHDFIDDDHLDCVWYGGDIGNVVYKGVIFDISVHGDVCLYGSYKGQEIYYKNKSNSGAIGTDLYYQIPDDKTLYQLSKFDLQEKTEDYLEWGNNNWVEFFYGDTGASDVADEDNVLEAVGEVLEFIEEFYRTYLDVGGESREQPQNDSDKHPVAIGAIEYLGTGGSVSERVEFTNENKFINQIKDDNYYGVPMVIVLYGKNGETIDRSFLKTLDPPPADIRFEELCPFCNDGCCEMSQDDNLCDGCSCSQNECTYRFCSEDTDGNFDDDSKKTFRFTYSVEGYVDIEVSAETEEEAEKIALERASEVDYGELYGIDWNRILVEVTDE